MAILWKRFQWWIWAALTVLVTGLLVILRGLIIRPKGDAARVQLPEVPPALKKKVEKAEEAALVTKALASAQSTERQERLMEIRGVDDGKKRRQQLANFLKEL